MKFAPKDNVSVVSTIYGNACSFVGMSGTVTKAEHGWVHVTFPELSDPDPIPFRERELSHV